MFVPFVEAFGGLERLLLGMSRFLHDRGLPHEVVCFADRVGLSSRATWPLRIRELRPGRNALAEARALHRHLAQSGGAHAPLLFDLKGAFYAGLLRMPRYHVHLTDPPSLLPADISKHAFSLRRTISGLSGLAAGMRGEVVHRITRRGARRAQTVVAMSDAIAAELRALYSIEPILVRPGVAMPPLPARERPHRVRFNGLSVSRLEPNKRVDWILRAWSRLRMDEPCQVDMLHIVGDGSQAASLQALASELGVSRHVVFHGPVPDARFDEMFCSADIFLMPAAQGYGLPALEALARGVPVVVHRDSGVSEILKATPWAEVIDEDVDQLAKATRAIVHRLASGSLQGSAAPAFPTESGWARRLSEVCGWG